MTLTFGRRSTAHAPVVMTLTFGGRSTAYAPVLIHNRYITPPILLVPGSKVYTRQSYGKQKLKMRKNNKKINEIIRSRGCGHRRCAAGC